MPPEAVVGSCSEFRIVVQDILPSELNNILVVFFVAGATTALLQCLFKEILMVPGKLLNTVLIIFASIR
jgi:hypothetical protein